MGMDLAALGDDPEAAAFHLNWTGWWMLRDLLTELGCDLTAMAGSNDGDVVDEATASAWGTALRDALIAGTLYEVFYRDNTYAGGERSEIHVEGTTTPVILSTSEESRVWVDLVMPTLRHEKESHEVVDTALEIDHAPRREAVTPASDTGTWLLEISFFFLHSGGFEQW